MAGIFVSYRRADSGDAAGRLFDHLVRRFGKAQVFMDVNGGIERGADYAATLQRALTECQVLLVLVGPTWATCTDDLGRRRLEQPDDWVRTEVTTALRRSIPIFPIVVGDAQFPPGDGLLPDDIASLARRQRSPLRLESWGHDVGDLFEAVGKHVAPIPDRPWPDTPDRRLLARLRESVKSIWVESVLKQSLHGLLSLELGKRPMPEAVDHPWRQVLELTAQKPEPTSRGTPILELFEKAKRQLLILGAPGAGKTTTLLELTKQLIARAEGDPAEPVPVVFNLSTWQGGSLMEWMGRELGEKYRVSAPGRQWLSGGFILPLLDGLDEIEAKHRWSCIEAINVWTRDYGLRGIAVCGRTKEYEGASARLALEGALHIEPLDDAVIERYVSHPSLAALQRMLADDRELRELAKTPVMLSILALTYLNQEVAATPAPSSDVRAVFTQYVRRMFRRRSSNERYSEASLLKWMPWLARGMSQHSQSIFLVERLQGNWLPKGWRNAYEFISWLLFTVALWPTVYAVAFQFPDRGPPRPLFPWLASGGLGAIWMLWAARRGALDIDLLRIYRWSWRHFLSTAVRTLLWGAISLGAGLFLATAMAVVIALLTSPDFVRADLEAGESPIAAVIAVWYLITVVWLFIRIIGGGYTGTSIHDGAEPNGGTRISLVEASRRTLIALLGWAVLTELAMVWVGASVSSTIRLFSVGSLLIAPPLFSLLGGFHLIRHYVLRGLMRALDVGPWRYVEFLDEVSRLAFMYRVGGGYSFIHRLLLEHLASDR